MGLNSWAELQTSCFHRDQTVTYTLIFHYYCEQESIQSHISLGYSESGVILNVVEVFILIKACRVTWAEIFQALEAFFRHVYSAFEMCTETGREGEGALRRFATQPLARLEILVENAFLFISHANSLIGMLFRANTWMFYARMLCDFDWSFCCCCSCYLVTV